jgi:CBS domain-containing protein
MRLPGNWKITFGACAAIPRRARLEVPPPAATLFDARRGNSAHAAHVLASGLSGVCPGHKFPKEVAMKVKDMMHKGVACLAPDATIKAVAMKMKELDVGAIPIAKNSQLAGMITDRDIAIRCAANGKDLSKLTAGDIMTPGVVYCRDTEEVEDAVRLMESKQIRRLPVLDESKRMVGMVSLGDISHALSQDIAGEVTKAVSAHHR